MTITVVYWQGTQLDVLALFGGSEDLQAVQLPDDGGQFVYAVGDCFEVYGYFRYDDGWRWTPRPRATVDFERLMSEQDWADWDESIGTTPGLTLRLLDGARR